MTTIAILYALLLGVAAVAIKSRDETIDELKARRIIDVLEVRRMRRERDAGRQALVDTECALGLAKELLAERDMPQWEIDLLTETPLYEATKEREAQVLEFRKHIPNDLGGAS